MDPPMSQFTLADLEKRVHERARASAKESYTRALLDKGVFTVMSIAPAVPAGKDLIRTAISAMHTDEQLERIAEAMAYAVKKL